MERLLVEGMVCIGAATDIAVTDEQNHSQFCDAGEHRLGVPVPEPVQ